MIYTPGSVHFISYYYILVSIILTSCQLDIRFLVWKTKSFFSENCGHQNENYKNAAYINLIFKVNVSILGETEMINITK